MKSSDLAKLALKYRNSPIGLKYAKQAIQSSRKEAAGSMSAYLKKAHEAFYKDLIPVLTATFPNVEIVSLSGGQLMFTIEGEMMTMYISPFNDSEYSFNVHSAMRGGMYNVDIEKNINVRSLNGKNIVKLLTQAMG